MPVIGIFMKNIKPHGANYEKIILRRRTYDRV